MYSKRKKPYERHNIWRSYSDMMAGLLLLFVLVMCVSFMQAQKNYQDRLDEEASHLSAQNELLAQIAEREDLLAGQQLELDEQNNLLASQQADLEKLSALLAAQQIDLDNQKALVLSQQSELEQKNSLMLQQQEELNTQKELVLTQQAELDEKNTLMLQQQAALDEQAQLMTAQQQKLEQIIGVKADLISELKQQFDDHELNVVIDEDNGSLALDSNILFGYNEDLLTEEGNSMLGELLPVYCKVLMTPEYLDYLASISIDGYTDTDGDYLYNLSLSQDRALAVANYLFSIADTFLNEGEMDSLRSKLTANGHSWSNPVYDETGAIDMEACRRVEIKFTLKDEEMINEMKQILDASELTSTKTE